MFRLLGLDLVVRDEEGNVLNPETASVIKIYREVIKVYLNDEHPCDSHLPVFRVLKYNLRTLP